MFSLSEEIPRITGNCQVRIPTHNIIVAPLHVLYFIAVLNDMLKSNSEDGQNLHTHFHFMILYENIFFCEIEKFV